MNTLIDGHTHLYDCHSPGAVLEGAAETFGAAGRALGIESASYLGVMVLVDPAGVDGYGRLRGWEASGWSVSPAGACALVATRTSDAARLLVVGGRQIRAGNGLEVLAYGIRDEFTDGGSLQERVEDVLDRGGLPVVPWGFGKWLGGRGRDVESLLRSSLARHVLLADSYTRPERAPEPGSFGLAEDLGVAVLAGTDPLPFPGQESRVGRYGFLLEMSAEAEDPAGELCGRLTALNRSPERYGARSGLLEACRVQVAMQLRGRRGPR